MSVKSKMTAIADKLRSILGITDGMSLDDMSEHLDTCHDVIDTQTGLLDHAIGLIADKAARPKDPTLQNKTVYPSEIAQSVTPDSGYDGLSSVYVGAIDNMYIGSGVERRDESDLTADGATITVQAGYYANRETKSVDTVELAAPEFDLDMDGFFTVRIEQPSGYVVGGTKDYKASLITKDAWVYTPSKTDQVIPAGLFLIGDQTIKGDANLVRENIKNGVSIFGVNGTHEGGAVINTSTRKLSSNSTSISFTGLTGEPTLFAINPTGNITLGSTRYVTSVKYDGSITHGTYGYRSGSSGTSYYSSSYFTWTYSNGTLTVKTSSSTNGGNFSSSVTYQLAYVTTGLPGGVQLPTLSNEGTSYDMLSGKQLIDHSGNIVTGSIPSKSATTYTPTTSNQTIASGTYLAGNQIIRGDSNLVAENIKSGISIFGVNGSYTGGTGTALPSGISKLASGTFNLTSDSRTHQIQHNLGVVPNFLLVFTSGDIVCENYSGYVYRYTAFLQNVIMFNGELIQPVGGYVDYASTNEYGGATSVAPVWGYDQSEHFTSTSATINIVEEAGASLKSGITYLWVCGVVDF